MSAVLTPTASPPTDTVRVERFEVLQALPPRHPVLIIESFHVEASAVEAWTDLWEALAPFATEAKGCQKFELLHDRKDKTRYSVLAEWNDMESYSRFRRETRVLWIERLMARVFHPGSYSSFDVVWTDPAHPDLDGITIDPRW